MSSKESTPEVSTISAPKFGVVRFTIRGTAPYVSNKFSAEMKEQMRVKQEAGSTAKGKKPREAKNFAEKAKQTLHVSTDGWAGMPASSFRQGLISACRLVNFKMTLAKLSISVEADGFDKEDATPMVKFTRGEPHYCEHYVRLATGVADIAPRMMWDVGWEAVVRVRYDQDQFTARDVANLFSRVGLQVGIGAGRPDSKTSAGMGWGTFELVSEQA